MLYPRIDQRYCPFCVARSIQVLLFSPRIGAVGGACVRAGAGPYAAWMPHKSLHGRTCGVSRAGTRASALGTRKPERPADRSIGRPSCNVHAARLAPRYATAAVLPATTPRSR
ncbi:hypothetical protein XcuCFBP2542_05300 [Xanthomonas cucurbitae]|uniref:Uncharacterized protein n=1 Tax=Xanthomonas cucurbitae TaxID=56453 RepID=A0A2S7DUY3_9XANT|nr:hypothetical protein XcuCFBP2542_05300 [Xanthomonas cucurbitae]QHG88127.1 hypothetical protein EBN15_15450 [Xanthomonas cucurbitae]